MQHRPTAIRPHPMLWRMGMGSLVAGLILVVGILRWQSLDLRPVHTDEAENAWILAKDQSGAGYVFNPEHHHGPVLNAWLRLPAKLFRYESYAQMEMRPLRAAVWAVGLLTLLVLARFSKVLGRVGALIAMGVAGTSGLLTYYGNMVIHETLLGALGLLAGWICWQWIHERTWVRASLLGLIAGCMLATKQTALIWFAGWGCASLFLVLNSPDLRNRVWVKPGWAQLGVAALIALGVAALLYTDGLRHPAGAGDAIRSLWHYQTAVEHEKPWTYYFTDLLLPIRQSPFGSYDWLLWAMAGMGVVASLIPAKHALALDVKTRRFAGFAGISTVVQLLAYTLVAYKTPWLMLGVWLHAALLAGVGARWIGGWSISPLRWLAWAGLLLLAGVQVQNAHRLNAVYHSDPRNPLAYAPTSANIERLSGFLEMRATVTASDADIVVVGDYIWPIPWYLRRFHTVEYVPGTVTRPTASIWILTDASYAALQPGWMKERQLFPFSLRPNVPVYVCLPNKSDSSDD